jgi:uncharacterized small protein (DUF1192 family)
MKLLLAVVLMVAAAHAQQSILPKCGTEAARDATLCFIDGEPRVNEIAALKAEIAKLRAELKEVKAMIAYPCKWGEHFVLNELQMTGGEGKCVTNKYQAPPPAQEQK